MPAGQIKSKNSFGGRGEKERTCINSIPCAFFSLFSFSTTRRIKKARYRTEQRRNFQKERRSTLLSSPFPLSFLWAKNGPEKRNLLPLPLGGSGGGGGGGGGDLAGGGKEKRPRI